MLYSSRPEDLLTDLAYLPKVTTAEVSQVIDDVSLYDHGVRVHYCVDPSELIDFCFPFNPIALRAKQVAHVAADQVALYELLFNFPEKPLLLPEYDSELESVRVYFRTMSGRVYKREELLTSFLRNASLDHLLRQRLDSETELLSLVRDEFNVFVALVMAINSIGVQRLEEICDHRLTRELDGNVDPPLREIWSGYQESGLAHTIFVELEAYARRRTGWSATERGSLLHFARTARTDATAADRLVYLNETCEDGAKRKKLSHRHVFLFLSSAARSERIFFDRPMVLGDPSMSPKPRHLLRNRRYFLIYAVNKALDAEGHLDTGATLSNLRAFQNAVKEIERLGALPADCGACPLRQDTSVTDCSRLELCATLKRVSGNLIRRRLEMENLGLLAGIQDYAEFREARPTGSEQQRIIRIFNQLLDHNYSVSASEKISELRWLITTRSRFATALGSAGRGTVGFLRERSDPVSVAAQYLPLQFSWKVARYKRIWDELFRVFLTPAPGGGPKQRMLNDIYEQFLRIDADLRTIECEHELMRSLLYLSMSELVSDRQAMAHALSMRRRCPGAESEFTYVALWAGRRARRYLKTAHIADAAVRKWPADARFIHGRALNTFAWRTDARGPEPGHLQLASAIADAERASAMYLIVGDEISKQLAAANYNNVAYWCSLLRDDEAFDLERGRRALEQLKVLLPRKEWEPLFPEYFHTEAFLEFREAEAALKADDLERARQKAERGLEQIREACRLDPPDAEYRDLRDDLQSLVNSLRRTV